MKSIKRKLFSISIILIILGINNLFADNGIRQAMKDEIQRSLDKLHLKTLAKPYYIEYSLTFRNVYSIKATLGDLTESGSTSNAFLNVGLRVGNYKTDNTNFLDIGFSFFGSGDDEERFTNKQVPLELDYNSLRRELWLSTDAAYKQISEIYTKKLATLKNRTRKDTTHDFIKIPAVKLYDTVSVPEFNQSKFENIARVLSKIFINHPKIAQSSVSIEYLPTRIYFVNSEGREYIKDDFYIGLEVVAATQADDGMPLSESYTAFSKHPAGLPDLDSLTKAVENIAGELDKLTQAPTLDEAYSGPVLFEGQAACEIFAQVFAPNLVTQRSPMTERGIQESDRYTAFQTKIGGRVLPEFLSIEAIPNKKKIDNSELLGYYRFDEDGVLAQNVNLVNNGFLKNLLSSRVPTKRVRKSNGHKRGGAAMLSTIEMTGDKAHIKSEKNLIKRMLKLCKDRELDFGIVIKKILDQNIQYTTLMRITAGTFPMMQGDSKKSIIEAYKVYQNGKVELIRGAESKGITVQSFKDILDIGNKSYILNYLAPSITSPYFTGGSQFVGASMIIPDLLFEDVEIKPIESDFINPPILKNPLSKIK